MRAIAALFIVAFTFPVAANPFGAPPMRYDEMVNPALQQVGSDLRIQEAECLNEGLPLCRFFARQVRIEAVGLPMQTGTGQLVLGATFQRENEREAQGLLDDVLTILGATMISYDPGMEASLRSEMIQGLGEAAITLGEGHRDSADVHYALTFDNVSGQLRIRIAPRAREHG